MEEGKIIVAENSTLAPGWVLYVVVSTKQNRLCQKRTYLHVFRKARGKSKNTTIFDILCVTELFIKMHI